MQKQLRTICVVVGIVMLLVTACCHKQPQSPTQYKGIDVSEYQGNINFTNVKKAGIEVVYIRAGEGSGYKDRMFETNYANAKQAGLKIGFYHFVTATTTEEAVQQATFFADLVKGTSPDCMLAMDFEVFGSLNNQQINAIALIFMQTLENTSGLKALVYSDLYNVQSRFDASLAVYPLWVADWNVPLPGNLGHWQDWVGFQYSDIGRVTGISVKVDLDIFTDALFL